MNIVKKFLALCLCAALMLSIWSVPAGATDERDGYTLVPLRYSGTGVDPASSFCLTVPEHAASDLPFALTIDGQSTPVITQQEEGQYLVEPSSPLLPNTLYRFRLTREDKPDITWVFQTAETFQITSTLPRNEATNVPVNTGIEITFSQEGYADLGSHFAISPMVEGKWQYFGDTAAFVPNSPLTYETIYTVTIQAGVPLANSDASLDSDYVFAFETAAASDTEAELPKASMYFYTDYQTLLSAKQPEIKFGIYHAEGVPAPAPVIQVYQFASDEQAISAVQHITAAARWSMYAADKNQIDCSGLQAVMTFSAADGYDEDAGVLRFPDTLSPGFYLVDARFADVCEQMILQVSDLPVQVIADDSQSIVWVNDAATGKSVTNAAVYDAVSGKTYTTDANGIAVVERTLASDACDCLIVTAPDGKKCIWLCQQQYGEPEPNGSAYWSALQLDRTLFQQDDTVNFWGFVQSRTGQENIASVTAVLTQGYGPYSSERNTMQKQTIPVQNGTYAGSLSLPNLDAGSYCLTVYAGDIALRSTYLTIQDYEKPAYELTIAADKEAVFAGETVTYTAQASFFEGTPVSELDITYRTSGYGLASSSAQGKTDLNGKLVVSQQPTAEGSEVQGEVRQYFTAEATLPETGPTSKTASVRVFVNDIDVAAKAKRDGASAELAVEVNTITLDRINNGTAKDSLDYLDAPVPNQTLNAQLHRLYWVKTPNGTIYDPVEKKNVTVFRYDQHDEIIDHFTLVTDASGKAVKTFSVPDRDQESYYIDLSTTDGNGRTVTSQTFIGEDYTTYFQNASSNQYYLDASAQTCQIGESVTLTLKRGTDAVMQENLLFVTAQEGIVDFQAGTNPYTLNFTDACIPNITVNAYYFDGQSYVSGYRMNKSISYRYENNGLTLTATMDKETYQPGDTCSLLIYAADKDGNPKEADINISVVDEALFALKDYQVDTLASLYQPLGSGLRLTLSSHDSRSAMVSGGGSTSSESDLSVPMGTPSAEMANDSQDIRKTFLDTALFSTVRTDAKGTAACTFQLPDNITSWRLTLSGVTSDLYAATTTQNIDVTTPMFLNYSLGDTFLIGDVPSVGLNVYGTSLSGSETVYFEVWDDSRPEQVYTASASAFERVDIPLWEMTEEGQHSLTIRATAENGTSDTLSHSYQVLRSLRQISTAQYYDVTPQTVFDLGTSGNASLTFTDKGRGQFLSALLTLRQLSGDRIEKRVTRQQADILLETYFPDLTLNDAEETFIPKQYQCEGGGMAILPYAQSDPETTVKLLPYIQDAVNLPALKNYLWQIYQSDSAESKASALYGLAILQEPVLLAIDEYQTLDSLSVKDAMYLALGYLALGESQKASSLYDAHIAPALESISPYWRIPADDQSTMLELTSLAAALSAKLDRPEREGLFRYCLDHSTSDTLTCLETLTYIADEIASVTSTGGTLTYSLFGDTYTCELSNGQSVVIQVPAQNADAFSLLQVTGDVSAVSVYQKAIDASVPSDPAVTVRRRYYKATEQENSSETFAQGDLIRVQVWIDYSAKAIDGSYSVTDYLPAGLAYVEGSAKIEDAPAFGMGCNRYVKANGQAVTFYDYNGRFDKGCLYYYYARVISPGIFKAEGTLVQNLTAKDSISIGPDDYIIIE